MINGFCGKGNINQRTTSGQNPCTKQMAARQAIQIPKHGTYLMRYGNRVSIFGSYHAQGKKGIYFDITSSESALGNADTLQSTKIAPTFAYWKLLENKNRSDLCD